jgi:hypothetical protein
MVIGILAALFGSAQAQCDDPFELVKRAERAVLEARLDDAQRRLVDMEAAFGCGPAASPDLLARMWISDGVMRSMKGAKSDASISFAAAYRASPGLWTEDFGNRLKTEYEASGQRESAPADLRLVPLPQGYGVAIDGVAWDTTSSLTDGLHLVQVGPDAAPMEFAKVVLLSPNAMLKVQTGLSLSSVEPGSPLSVGVDEDPTKRSPAWLLSAGGAGVVALAMAGGAYAQNPKLKAASSTQSLDKAYARQKGFGVAAVASTGVAATAFTLHWVL